MSCQYFDIRKHGWALSKEKSDFTLIVSLSHFCKVSQSETYLFCTIVLKNFYFQAAAFSYVIDFHEKKLEVQQKVLFSLSISHTKITLARHLKYIKYVNFC